MIFELAADSRTVFFRGLCNFDSFERANILEVVFLWAYKFT